MTIVPGLTAWVVEEWWPDMAEVGWPPRQNGSVRSRVDDDYGWFQVGPAYSDPGAAILGWMGRVRAANGDTSRFRVVGSDAGRRRMLLEAGALLPEQKEFEMEPSTGTSMYAKYGGREIVRMVVDLFYDKVLADPALQPIFLGRDLTRIKHHQRSVITIAMSAEGQDRREAEQELRVDSIEGLRAVLRRAHYPLALTTEQFGRVAEHLREALVDGGVSKNDADDLVSVVASFHDDVVPPAQIR